MKRISLSKKNEKLLGSFNRFDPAIEAIAADHGDEDRFFRRAILVALAAHLVLLAIVVPSRPPDLTASAADRPVFVVQQVRFQQPPPTQQKAIPKRKTKKVPVPDPTPDDPEPILREELVENDLDLDLPESDLVFSVPDGPPSPGRPGPIEVSGDVVPPRKISGEQPLFTEDARVARVQGVVILRAIIDAVGNVTDIEVLKGLPFGLTESAVETVSDWRFEPARLDGEPVPVYYMLTITFRIQ